MLEQVVITNEDQVLAVGCEALDAEPSELEDYGITTAEEMLDLLVLLGNDEDEPDQASEYRQTVRDLLKGPRWQGVQVGSPAVAVKPSPQPKSHPAPTTDPGRCIEPGCGELRMTRQGSRGPHPKRCAEHAKARHRGQNAGRIVATKPREEVRPPCCVDAGDILCPQHEQQREYDRYLSGLPTEAEAGYMNEAAGEDAWHLDGLAYGFNGATGPDEGETVRGLRRQRSAEATAWLNANADWSRGL